MKKTSGKRVSYSFATALCSIALSTLVLSGCMKDKPKDPPVLAFPGNYKQVNLVGTNNAYSPSRIDPLLGNAWGISWSTGGTPWISAQAGHVSTVYDKDGNQARAAVAIPGPNSPTGGNPTGTVFNGSNDFVLSNGAAARFLFVGIDGVVSGWNAAAGNTALRVINNSGTSAYTGMAIGVDKGANFLYAANFRTNNIDVFDKSFGSATKSFKDPNLPTGYAPFNVQNIGDTIYVVYAKVGADGRDEPGMGNGFVSMFTPGGVFIKRFASKGPLNAPWGIAKAPAGFLTDNLKMYPGQSAVLVGNFGDGHIIAYDENGKLLGYLTSDSKPIVIDGLWALSFPPVTATNIDLNRLYFAAGPDHETQGLFGYIQRN